MTDILGSVGTSPAKLEINEKVLGRAKYIADLYRTNMLHGAILSSPHAHARILSYNTAAAMALPAGLGWVPPKTFHVSLPASIWSATSRARKMVDTL